MTKTKATSAAKKITVTAAPATIESPLIVGRHDDVCMEYLLDEGKFSVYLADESRVKDDQGSDLIARFTSAEDAEVYYSALLLFVAVLNLRHELGEFFSDRTLIVEAEQAASGQVFQLREHGE